MLTSLVRLSISFGVIMAAVLTALSLLTPLYPPLEMINHFRPFILFGSILLLAIAFFVSSKKFRSLCVTVIIANIALLMPAALYTNASSPGNSETFKLISFNVLISNISLGKAKDYLIRENADIIVFQEFGYEQERLLEQIKQHYPYQYSCARNISCLMAIVSKRPFKNPSIVRRHANHPPLITADFTTKSGKGFKVAGVHVSWPLAPFNQETDLKWLAQFSRRENGPLIIAGDFNHTPWSWRLTRFAHASGLKRHATLMASWPAFFPGFLIDHVFSSEEVVNLSNHSGPNLNSDHRPVITIFAIK